RVRAARLGGAIAAVAGVTALDVLAATRASRMEQAAARPVRRAITIRTSPERAYGFWRELRNQPRFMDRIESVEVMDHTRSRWRARGPAGKSLEWEAEIVDDRPNQMIAWRSVGDASVDNSGQVWFRPAPGGRGTEVELELRYALPLGR